MKSRIARFLTAAAIAAAAAWGHYTWISPAEPLEIGRTAHVRIGHGHRFPQSEEAINATQVDLFVLTPSGKKVALEPVVSASAVTASFTVKETGLHRIAFVQDRGVSSRTPRGVRPGGRSRNPDASQSSRTLRSAVAYASAGNLKLSGAKPLGLEFEMVGEHANGAWKLVLLRSGKPVPGAAIEAFATGASRAEPVGTTAADGTVTYRPAGAKGSVMFSAEIKGPVPEGADYDAISYSTSLYVSW